jgi:hypothetical protein
VDPAEVYFAILNIPSPFNLQCIWHNIVTILQSQVEHVLKVPSYATLERLEHRWNIEHFKVGGFQILKSAYRWGPLSH